MHRDGKLAGVVLGKLEVFAHPALSCHAAAEWHRLQVAAQVVRPLMIRTDEGLHVAGQFAAEFGGSMAAAVLKHRDTAVFATRNHDRSRSDIAPDEVAGHWDFGFEADIIPRASMKDA